MHTLRAALILTRGDGHDTDRRGRLASSAMGTVILSRPPRRAAPPMPTGEIAIEPPPVIPQPTGQRWQQWLSVVPMLAGTVATALMFGGGREGANTYTYVVGGIFGLSTLGMLVTNWGGSNGPRKGEAHPGPPRLPALPRRTAPHGARGDRRAAHRPAAPAPRPAGALGRGARAARVGAPGGRPDFGSCGSGSAPSRWAAKLVAPAFDPAANLEPVTAGAVRRFLDAYAVVPDLPVALNLRGVLPRRGHRVAAGAGARPGPGGRGAARRVPRPRRRARRRVRGARPAADVGVAQVAAARPAPHEDRRPGAAAARRAQPHRAGRTARRRGGQAQTGRAGHRRGHLAARRGRSSTAATRPARAPGPARRASTGSRSLDLGGPPPSPARRGAPSSCGSSPTAASPPSRADERARVGTADALSLAETESLARRLAPLRLESAAADHAPLARRLRPGRAARHPGRRRGATSRPCGGRGRGGTSCAYRSGSVPTGCPW